MRAEKRAGRVPVHRGDMAGDAWGSWLGPAQREGPEAAWGCCVEAGQGLSRALAAGAWKAEEGSLAGVLGQAEAGLRVNPALRGVWAGQGMVGAGGRQAS